ncbi:MAG: hypothetical protein Q4G19_06355 [Clostridia bacterium]|nr:hypothetical protein [Clostridia bacterium]
MKKMLASLLALMLLFSCTALAENVSYVVDEGVTVTAVIPEGYKAYDAVFYEGNLIAGFEPEICENAPCMTLMVCPSEEYTGLERLNDLPEDELAQLKIDLCEDLNNPTVGEAETGLGTKLIVINENYTEFNYDSVTIYTLYKGYLIQLFVVYADVSGVLEKTVTDADIDNAIQFLTDIVFE